MNEHALETEIAILRQDVNRSFQDHGRYEKAIEALERDAIRMREVSAELQTDWKLATAVGGFAGSLIVLLVVFIATGGA